MAEQREYETAIIASIWSGRLLTEFGRMHQAIEELMGGDVWTHQIPAVLDTLKPYIADWCPEIAAFDFSNVTPENWESERARLLKAVGDTVTVRCPLVDDHKPDPLRDIPRGMTTIIIDT